MQRHQKFSTTVNSRSQSKHIPDKNFNNASDIRADQLLSFGQLKIKGINVPGAQVERLVRVRKATGWKCLVVIFLSASSCNRLLELQSWMYLAADD